MKDAVMATIRAPVAAERSVLEEDFETVVRDHQKRIYRILLFMLRDPDEADTLTQECFLRAYARRKAFRGEARLSTWLIRIAINLAQDQLRSRRRNFWRRMLRGKDTEAIPVADRRSTPEDAVLAREQATAIWTVAASLPLQQRMVFTLRFGEEMPLYEIAQTLGRHEGTVKAHLSSAIRTVRKALTGCETGDGRKAGG